MKRIGATVLFLFLSCCLHAEVAPKSGFYLRIDAGYSSSRDPELRIPEGSIPAKTGGSPLIGAGIGYSIVPGIRTDFVLGYRGAFEQISGFAGQPAGRADLSSLTGMLSVYLDIFTAGPMSLYGSFGSGFAHNRLDQVRISNPDGSLLGTIDGKSKSNFAWQISAGIDFSLTDQFALDMGYLYMDAGKYESEQLLVLADTSLPSVQNTGHLRTNSFFAALRYTF